MGDNADYDRGQYQIGRAGGGLGRDDSSTTIGNVMSQHSCADCVERPGWLDASFYSKWLLAAAEAQNLWSEAVQSDCEFSSQIERLELVGYVCLGIEAFQIVGKMPERVRTSCSRRPWRRTRP
jgi:hypothetical protein